MIVEEMKKHNAIPQQIQMELMKAQYDVYCIVHFALWFLKHYMNMKERKEEVVSKLLSIVNKEIISFDS